MTFEKLLRSLRPARAPSRSTVTLDDEIALYRYRAAVALQEERYQDALVFLAKVLRLNPYDLDARITVAEVYHLFLSEPTKAVLTYEKVIAAAGYDDSNPYCAAAREALRQLTTPEEPAFPLAAELDPNLQDESGGFPQIAAG